jgi:DNA-binding NtrC family response regulator
MTATILVVDDEPDLKALVLQKFRRQIRDGSISFMFARDGIEALQSLEQNPNIDLVLSDINMPRMDGLLLLQKLQEAEDKRWTIIVSAYGDMSNIRIAMNRGAFDFLTKPIDFVDLEAQDIADAGGAHFAEGDLLRVGCHGCWCHKPQRRVDAGSRPTTGG